MGEPLRQWAQTESCHWIRHSARPAEWTRPAPVLTVEQWRVPRAGTASRHEAEIDEDNVADLLGIVQQIYTHLLGTETAIDRAFEQLSAIRENLRHEEAEIADLKRAVRDG